MNNEAMVKQLDFYGKVTLLVAFKRVEYIVILCNIG